MSRPPRLEDLHGSTGTTHFRPRSYDPHLLPAFYGAPLLPGEYHERVAPVDLGHAGFACGRQSAIGRGGPGAHRGAQAKPAVCRKTGISSSR
jgi:hypothetical protein